MSRSINSLNAVLDSNLARALRRTSGSTPLAGYRRAASLATLAALLACSSAMAQVTHYRGKWTIRQTIATRVNDLHIKISIDEPAFVMPAHNFVKDVFARATYVLDRASFTAVWDRPTRGVNYGQSVTVGFDFKTDKPWRVSSAYWTLDGETFRGWEIPLSSITFEKVAKSERFDRYQPGPLCGQGDWQSWNNDPQGQDFIVTPQQALSPPHSVEIDQLDNALMPYHGFDRGLWLYSAFQYIPSDFTSGSSGGQFDGSHLILLNTYEPNGPQQPSVHLQVDSNTGMLSVYHGDGLNTIQVPYITDQWVPIEMVIDLDNDVTQVFYDTQLIAEYSWTAGAFGQGGGAPNIAAVALAAGGSSSVFYDDIVLEELELPCDEADMNCDGQVDAGDIEPFLGLLFGGETPCGPCTGDLNGDGNIDALDIEGFLGRLFR